MEYCVKCGIEDARALLYDVISPKGIVKICRRCNLEEEFPLIRQVSSKKVDIEERPSVRERLSKYAGVNPKEHRERFSLGKDEGLQKQEIGLKEIVDKNFKKTLEKDFPVRHNLIHNFHWIIMRARRSKKLTQSQFAREIQESEEAVRTIEQGIVPKEYGNLILKIENYLGVNLRELEREEGEDDLIRSQVKKQFEKSGEFDKFTTRNLTISDLKNMNRETSNFSVRLKDENFLDPFQKDDVRKLREETDLSEEEIEKIIYGEKV